MSDLPRCRWCLGDALYIHYHDHEWGKPLDNEHQLFELLCLEGQQAGLSWLTVLKKTQKKSCLSRTLFSVFYCRNRSTIRSRNSS